MYFFLFYSLYVLLCLYKLLASLNSLAQTSHWLYPENWTQKLPTSFQTATFSSSKKQCKPMSLGSLMMISLGEAKMDIDRICSWVSRVEVDSGLLAKLKVVWCYFKTASKTHLFLILAHIRNYKAAASFLSINESIPLFLHKDIS